MASKKTRIHHYTDLRGVLRLGSGSCRLQNLVITFTGDGDKDARHATAAQPGGERQRSRVGGSR